MFAKEKLNSPRLPLCLPRPTHPYTRDLIWIVLAPFRTVFCLSVCVCVCIGLDRLFSIQFSEVQSGLCSRIKMQLIQTEECITSLYFSMLICGSLSFHFPCNQSLRIGGAY